LQDDIDTPLCVRILSAATLPAASLAAGAAFLGIDLSEAAIDIDVETFVRDRLAFIAQKNWAEADKIRDELLTQGIQLKDAKDPVTGERVTTWEVKR
jgi:cysteinyl-tRNA synthetase